MFEKGDYIVYGGNGVCKVESVGKIHSAIFDKNKMYYTLSPCYTRASKIFTPVDNEKVIMRRVLSKEDALSLIDEMMDIGGLWIDNEKNRETEYKEAFRSCDCREWIKIIKTIYLRRIKRVEAGKKVTATDEKYFKMAEDSLYGELAIPLEMDREQVKEFIVDKMSQNNE